MEKQDSRINEFKQYSQTAGRSDSHVHQHHQEQDARHNEPDRLQEAEKRLALQDELLREYRKQGIRSQYCRYAVSGCLFSLIIVIGFLVYWYQRSVMGSHFNNIVCGILALLFFTFAAVKLRSLQVGAEQELHIVTHSMIVNQEHYEQLQVSEPLSISSRRNLLIHDILPPLIGCLFLVAVTAGLCLFGSNRADRNSEQRITESYEQGLSLYQESSFTAASDALQYAIAKNYSPAKELNELCNVNAKYDSRQSYQSISPFKKIAENRLYSEYIRSEAQASLDQILDELYKEGIRNKNQHHYRQAANSFYHVAHENYKDSVALYSYCIAYNSATALSMNVAKSYLQDGVSAPQSESTREFGQEVQEYVEEQDKYYQQLKKEQELQFLRKLRSQTPYKGLDEKYIGQTKLGGWLSKTTQTERENGIIHTYNIYTFDYSTNYYFNATCENGFVVNYWHQKKPGAKTSQSKRTNDPYHAKDYVHPDDFYYDYYDDFWDYEDAEDYWEEYG